MAPDTYSGRSKFSLGSRGRKENTEVKGAEDQGGGKGEAGGGGTGSREAKQQCTRLGLSLSWGDGLEKPHPGDPWAVPADFANFREGRGVA